MKLNKLSFILVALTCGCYVDHSDDLTKKTNNQIAEAEQKIEYDKQSVSNLFKIVPLRTKEEVDDWIQGNLKNSNTNKMFPPISHQSVILCYGGVK